MKNVYALKRHEAPKFFGSVFGPFTSRCQATGTKTAYCYLDVDTELFKVTLIPGNKPTISPFNDKKDTVLFLRDFKKLAPGKITEITSERELLNVLQPDSNISQAA